MGEVVIRNLENLIQQYTGPGKKLVDSQVTKLTAPGENYVGLVLKVVATLKDENGKEEKFNAVAKCLNFDLPDFFQKMIPSQYNKEKAFYVDIVPTLQQFQVEQGLEEPSIEDVFPILYTCRSSLKEHGEPDKDAVLLFENLSTQGYSNADRTVGFDFEGAQLVLKDLSFFHAAPIALKIKKPEQFENKIKTHLKNMMLDENGPEPPPPTKENIWITILQEYEEVKPYLDTLNTILKMDPKAFKEKMKKVPKEPFVSISHNDLWTNNTMQIFSEEKPIKNKLIDFQMYQYDSIAKDLLFFICTSVILPVLQEHFDDLIDFYYKNFINILDKLGCNTTPFSYENFLEELNAQARDELGHIIFFQIPVFGKKGEAVFDLKDGNPMDLKKEKVSEIARSRAVQIIQIFGKKGWI